MTTIKKAIDFRSQPFKEFLPEVTNFSSIKSSRVKSAANKKVFDIEKKNYALSSARVLDNFGVTMQDKNVSGEREVTRIDSQRSLLS